MNGLFPTSHNVINVQSKKAETELPHDSILRWRFRCSSCRSFLNSLIRIRCRPSRTQYNYLLQCGTVQAARTPFRTLESNQNIAESLSNLFQHCFFVFLSFLAPFFLFLSLRYWISAHCNRSSAMFIDVTLPFKHLVCTKLTNTSRRWLKLHW